MYVALAIAQANGALHQVFTKLAGGDQPQDAGPAQRDGFPAGRTVNIGPYSVLVFSQDSP